MNTKADEGMALLAGLVLEDGRRWGEAATDWQRDDARAVLDTTGPRSHFQTRPRGASKSTDVAGVGVAVAVTQLAPGSRGYVVAADRDQGRLIVDSVAGFRERTPGLAGAISVDSYRVTATRSRASLEVLAADSASAWGLRPALLVADEIAQWRSTREPQALWKALVSATGKVSDARLVVLTSAGDPAHWSYRILEHARRSDRWRVSEVPGPVPWTSPAWLAEQRALLAEWEYARLHLNTWASADDVLTTADALRECVRLDGPLEARPGVRYVIGLDVGLTNDRCVAAVCHAEDLDGRPDRDREGEFERTARAMVKLGVWDRFTFDERMAHSTEERQARPTRVVLDRMATWSGSRRSPVNLSEVEVWVKQASESYGGAPVVFDPFQAVHLTQRLAAVDVSVKPFTFSSGSVGRLAMVMYRLLRDRALVLPDDPALLDELGHVRLREVSPGVIRMDHDAGRHDDRAIALALAASELLSRPAVSAATVTRYRFSALGGTR